MVGDVIDTTGYSSRTAGRAAEAFGRSNKKKKTVKEVRFAKTTSTGRPLGEKEYRVARNFDGIAGFERKTIS